MAILGQNKNYLKNFNMINSNELITRTKDLSVLFVDDNDELRDNISEILKKFFKHIDTSHNGEDAMEKYIEYHENNSKFYDIVLSDIQMPILNGIELTTHIYSMNPSQTIIILSAFDNTEYLLSLINLGVDQFIKKPIDYQELLRAFANASQKINTNKSSDELYTTKVQLNNKFIYDRDTHSLMNENENIYLTKYEIIFLQLLTTSVGRIYSNDDIVKHYNSLNESIDAKNIRKLVSKFRKKLPENSLESIYGVGYKLVPYFEHN